MTAVVINGKDLAADIREDMKEKVALLKKEGIQPHLTVILVGNDPASKSYVAGKEKASKEVGIQSEIIRLDETTTEDELLDMIEQLNKSDAVHGILVQLPLPEHISEQAVIETIHPEKDVDGFHPINIGRMMTGQKTYLPCTPYGIITMLKSQNIEMEGKHAVIIGRSNIVGKPVGQLLLNEHATVTYCHSRTKNLKDYTTKADILVVAVGRPHVVQADHIKAGAAVIDVGVNRLDNGTLTGDVDFESAQVKAGYITPVPQGVGPMTITMLLQNTIQAAKERLNH
ncbi:MAG TPA: bifunctional methylenetetrahydrofolate dehydrogenase/methenyltetrahydrofolate cyclohydrolase FolD [Bacillota bacterium]|nr:bifunctional methylenetetrahydrofolate dehydrogenase/methenyltetrahydrofolate cyclohydrolase FolD [Bacillota bacterium]